MPWDIGELDAVWTSFRLHIEKPVGVRRCFIWPKRSQIRFAVLHKWKGGDLCIVLNMFLSDTCPRTYIYELMVACILGTQVLIIRNTLKFAFAYSSLELALPRRWHVWCYHDRNRLRELVRKLDPKWVAGTKRNSNSETLWKTPKPSARVI